MSLLGTPSPGISTLAAALLAASLRARSLLPEFALVESAPLSLPSDLLVAAAFTDLAASPLDVTALMPNCAMAASGTWGSSIWLSSLCAETGAAAGVADLSVDLSADLAADIAASIGSGFAAAPAVAAAPI